MRFGIDIGGTKIEAIALDDSGVEVMRERVPTPAADYPSLLEAVRDLVVSFESQLGAEATVGVGHPGVISPATGQIKNSNSQALLGQALDHDLAAILDRPVRLANDADCFALSEATDGAGAGFATVFGVILGTGVGGGVVVSGRLVHGPNAIAGEWGHNPLPPSAAGPVELLDCYCGRAGCIERYLSGPGISADHLAMTGIATTAAHISAAAQVGEPDAVATLDRYVERLAAGLAVVINILDPAVIVLGGGVSNIQALYEQIPQRWDGYVFSDRVDTQLAQNLHGDSSGVRGAAWLWD
jgi:fructokinase